MKKQLICTFDYELFLGESSGTVENCLIKPTNKIHNLLSKHAVSAIFFVDTLYLFRLKEIISINNNAKNDYETILSQLRKLIDTGNYVFYHIHPHWLDAKYLENNNQWDLSSKEKFALNNLSEKELKDVFNKSSEIIKEIYKDRRLPEKFGIRAGGLYAQPFEYYKQEMKAHNISLDFSVLRNAKSRGENGRYEFNYAHCPTENIYKFSTEVNLSDTNGEFTEIILNQFQLNGLSKIANGLYYRKNKNKPNWKKLGDGASSGNILKSTQKQYYFKSEETFSIELLNNFKSLLYYNHFKKNNYLHIISHPKLCSLANIQAFDYFLARANKNFEIVSDIFKII